jgi:hypothetical protein
MVNILKRGHCSHFLIFNYAEIGLNISDCRYLLTPIKPHPMAPSPLHFALKAKVFRPRAQGEGEGNLEGLRPSNSSLAKYGC